MEPHVNDVFTPGGMGLHVNEMMGKFLVTPTPLGFLLPHCFREA